ncbi:hypothetical protein CCO02nite_12930 [Cellulomonas composti]|uniref:HTH marR-type domain-containing protein n=2 Tax=Cellulomonas composti TaxID=266130 RepID=A0A511J9G7_9CELL|nr:hypothetical protein CCO02nite_12930 [Cellulomonas composti]
MPRERRAARLLGLISRHQHVARQRNRLNTAELRILWLLTDGRPRTLRVLSEHLGLEQSTVNRQVNAAIDAGLLRRFSAPGHTAKLLEPTPEGVRQLEEDMAGPLGAADRALDAIGEDADHFLDVLERFVTAYGAEVNALSMGDGADADAAATIEREAP